MCATLVNMREMPHLKLGLFLSNYPVLKLWPENSLLGSKFCCFTFWKYCELGESEYNKTRVRLASAATLQAAHEG